MSPKDLSQFQTVELIITGKVQGVGFRYFAKTQADRLGITGLVRNQANGSVYIIAQGSEEIVKEFVTRLKEGPVISEVEAVELSELSAEKIKQFQTFLSSGTFLVIR